MTEERLQRATDHGFWCTLAIRFGDFWDFVQARHVDKQVLIYMVFGMALYSVYWSMEYVWQHPEQPGADVALKLGAITLPLTWIIPKITEAYFKFTTTKENV